MKMMPMISCGLLALLVIATDASAQCMRVVPKDPKSPPDVDGPGAFGPLQGTLTLDCLRFEGVIYHGKQPIALVRDERGRTYRIKVGDAVGEHGGIVRAISPKRIRLLQLVSDGDGGWVEVTNYLLPQKDALRP